MPITGPSSYPGTVDAFLAHWALANSEAAPGSVVVAPLAPGAAAITRADLVALGGDLTTARTAVQAALNDLSVARETARQAKLVLLDDFDLFAARLRAFYGSTVFLTSLPDKPKEGEMGARFLATMEDALTLWGKIDAAPAPPGVTLPLTLPGATGHDEFAEKIEELRAALAAQASAEQDADLARARRNAVQDAIYPILRDYRLAVPATLGKNNPVTQTLPRLSPLPGKTPAGVSAGGSFATPENEAVITHTLSPEPDVKNYQLRQSPPPTYSKDDETVVATHGPGDPPVFRTNVGLVGPSDRSLYRVYVINDDDREKGSNVVEVEWPPE